jgi:anaerobic magnesium-protoporphyrin IX monomethyl ester cyclase
MGIKVLFVYPNTFGMNMVPSAISLFTAILKREGHVVGLFDLTSYKGDYEKVEGARVVRLGVIPFKPNKHGIKVRTTDWRDDIKKKVDSFKPDLIALSCTEDMWQLGTEVLGEVEDYITRNKTPVIAGGVFATFAPEIAIQQHLVNLVCVGEGENSLIDLCRQIEKGDSFDNITNLWVKKKDGSIIKNQISNPYDINESPIIDVSLFEDNRLYRPMEGKWFKMMPVETIRGCPYKCAFCNSPDQMDLYRKEAGADFFRKKKIDLIYKELKHFKEELGVEYNYFWADTFLTWNSKEFDEFCDMYADIGLPFWMQTRPETVTDYNIGRLAKVGLHRITFGIEHGNEQFRAKYLDRRWKNKDIIEALKIPPRHGIAFSVNNITGFPTETRELAMDTVELNRHIDSSNAELYPFVPFHGTPLRKTCEDLGLITPDVVVAAMKGDSPTIMVMDQYSLKEIKGLLKCFSMYVKFPKSYWPDIRKAEEDTEEGERIYSELREKYEDKFMLLKKK